MSEIKSIRLPPGLVLTAPDGSALAVDEPGLRARYDGAVLRDVTLTFSVSPTEWRRVDAGGWFNTPPERRGPCFAGGFHDEAPIEIEAALDPDAITLVGMLSDDVYELGAAIRYARVSPEVLKTESWRAREVKQRRGEIKTGFVTM